MLLELLWLELVGVLEADVIDVICGRASLMQVVKLFIEVVSIDHVDQMCVATYPGYQSVMWAQVGYNHLYGITLYLYI